MEVEQYTLNYCVGILLEMKTRPTEKIVILIIVSTSWKSRLRKNYLNPETLLAPFCGILWLYTSIDAKKVIFHLVIFEATYYANCAPHPIQ
jgi:hypothetical protein